MSIVLSDVPLLAAADSRPAAPRRLALWMRLTAAIALALVVAWSLMIYLTYSQRREGSIAQARDFAESVSQMTTATLTGLMITKIVDKRAVFLDQMRNSNNIRDLKVLRYGSTIAQFGAGEGDESQVTPEERGVMQDGKPFFRIVDEGEALQAIYPVLNSPNHLGKNCMKCHEDREGAVLGAISMKVSLKKTQADLREFTGRLAWLAVGLSIPLLWAIFLLVRRYVVRPLGGEPSEATLIANRIAAGDLGTEVAVRKGDTTSVIAAMAVMRGKLSAIVGQIDRSAGAIGRGVDEVAGGSRDLSRRTEDQASSLEETAAAMEQLTSAVSANAQSASRASELAVGAAEVAGRGGRTIGQVVDTMGAISASSRSVAEIIGVIDAIAFQTNLLAVNAAVEAARAGHEGRAFAVVAGEVRMLAQRTAEAARQIKGLIEDSVRNVDDGSRLVDEAGRTMGEIVASVQAVTGIMTQIATASREQRAGITEVSKALSRMDQVTQQNAALVEDTASALESLKEQAHSMALAVSAFSLRAGGTMEA